MLLLLVTSLTGYSMWIAITWPMLILKNRCIFHQISRGMDANTFCHTTSSNATCPNKDTTT